MAGGKTIKGITVEIGGDTTKLGKALDGVTRTSRNLQGELKQVNNLLKLDPGNTDLLAQKQKILADSIEATKDKLDILREAQSQIEQQYAAGTIDRGAYLDFQRELVNTEQRLDDLKEKQKEFGSVAKQVMQEAAGKVNEFGEKMSGAGQSLLPATAAVTGFAALSVKAMDDVDAGLDVVMQKTGATGEEAAALGDVFNEVATSIPGEFADAGAAVGEVNTRLGFTGDALRDASEAFLKYAKVNGTDVNTSVQLVTRAMGDAGIAAEDYGSVLDSLTVAGQKSGISVDTLATNLAKYGAPMRQLGLDTQQSIALFAGWEKAGVNTEIAFSGMKKAISNWAAEGKDASVEFQNVLDKIAAAPDLATASTMAIEVFGAKAGPDLADAIQGGRFAVDEYVEALKNSEGAVQGTYDMIVDEVDDTARAQQTLKVALHDVGETIAKTAGPWLLKLAQYVKNVMDKFNQLSPGAQTAILAFVAVAGAIGPVLITLGKLAQGVGSIISLGGTIAGKIPALTKGIKALWGVISANPFGIIITLITAVVAAVIYLWNTNENFRNFILMCWQNIQAAALAFFNYLANIFTVQKPAAFSQLTAWIAAVFTTDWTTRFGVLGNLVNAFFANVSNIFTALRTVFSGIVDFVKGVFTGNWSLAWEGVKKIFKGIFDSFTAIAKAPLNGVIGLLNMAIDGVNKLISGFNGIGFDMPDWLGGGSWHPSIPSIPNIPYLAKGGVLQEGEAIVAEAGPEHIKLMNGRAVVTPLSGKAKITPAGGGIGQQTNNFYNYKPRDGEKVARDLNRRLGISVRPVRV